ncbi:hypothetical protein H2201_006434 [Coniosporium apollinis]|uniref:Alpha/beta hydrolase fold-3 domain-containing protein n=1 Tax=Coniosporium apollinis TaxID=61459 RepID=A0ABQ9NS26_9PEZI|nr:hypothetical protein H2201_006434 [Coniosporium apollinis]
MVLNTFAVGAAVVPTVVGTSISHCLNRKSLRQKPTERISYHQGLQLVRSFLGYASLHTVDDLQAFTSQWVPVPRWVHVEEVSISKDILARSAELLQAQLGPIGIEQVGGKQWWQWRRDNGPLKAEWIEMRKDYNERMSAGDTQGQRIILYVHGGAYFFGSVDEHRYQMQRHARKLKARLLAPRYRLAPQFPFPCGLQDCLAAYLFLLEAHAPSTIVLAGDSAGGGMTLSMLVTLRDQGIPLPAGAVLLSPWVDLTHSFPSVAGNGEYDYIPPHGFIHKPSMAWPPPSVGDLNGLTRSLEGNTKRRRASSKSSGGETQEKKITEQDAVRGFSADPAAAAAGKITIQTSSDTTKRSERGSVQAVQAPRPLTVPLGGSAVTIFDQIQLYAPNHLLTHPLVSPLLQPSLGGLPPLLILVGGGELLRDEQIYLAHKAADPLKYAPTSKQLAKFGYSPSQVTQYPPTDVQLQVWDDLCHVAVTLSWTRPAKHMYRAVAQFGAWCLAHAQQTAIDILDDDDISIVSEHSSSTPTPVTSEQSSSENVSEPKQRPAAKSALTFATPSAARPLPNFVVGKAGDPLPPFTDHMIRQRVDRHGHVYPLAPAATLDALRVPPAEIGVIKEGPTRKWMAAQNQFNKRFAKEKRAVQRKRVDELRRGYERFEGETPPPTALAGRRLKEGAGVERRVKRSWGMSLWSLWGSKHDVKTIAREERAGTQDLDSNPEEKSAHRLSSRHLSIAPRRLSTASRRPRRSTLQPPDQPRSRHRSVTDEGQARPSIDPRYTSIPPPHATSTSSPTSSPTSPADRCGLPGGAPSASEARYPPTLPIDLTGAAGAAPLETDVDVDDVSTVVPATETRSTRPTWAGVAYPFKLRVEGVDEGSGGKELNASTVTLDSVSLGEGGGEGAGEESSRTSEKAGAGDDSRPERPRVERFVTAREEL